MSWSLSPDQGGLHRMEWCTWWMASGTHMWWTCDSHHGLPLHWLHGPPITVEVHQIYQTIQRCLLDGWWPSQDVFPCNKAPWSDITSEAVEGSHYHHWCPSSLHTWGSRQWFWCAQPMEHHPFRCRLRCTEWVVLCDAEWGPCHWKSWWCSVTMLFFCPGLAWWWWWWHRFICPCQFRTAMARRWTAFCAWHDNWMAWAWRSIKQIATFNLSIWQVPRLQCCYHDILKWIHLEWALKIWAAIMPSIFVRVLAWDKLTKKGCLCIVG